MAFRDEYLDMFPHLNRIAVKLRFKRALYDWANTAEPRLKLDPEKERYDDGAVYLLPDIPMITDWVPALKEFYHEIFEHELWNLIRDDEKWPKDRSWEKFNEFFEYSFNSGIVDLIEDEPLVGDDELYDPEDLGPLHLPELKAILKDACTAIYGADKYLIDNNLNERTITHRLAIPLEMYLMPYNVDCEYNKMTDSESAAIKKKLNTDGEEKAVWPDIIVHKRGSSDDNLLAVEVKGQPAPGLSHSVIDSYKKDKEYDLKKLEAYCKELGYAYGVFIELGKGGVTEEIWFKKGKRV